MNPNNPVAYPSQNSVAANRDNYDLDDAAADLIRWPELGTLLKVLRAVLVPTYLAADQSAIRQRQRHCKIVWWAAVFGTLAVLCAIVELPEICMSAKTFLDGSSFSQRQQRSLHRQVLSD